MILAVELFQFIAVPPVPDPVTDHVAFRIQYLVDLEIIRGRRGYIQPAADPMLDILIQFIHPLHPLSLLIYRHRL